MKIGGFEIGHSGRPYIVAEISGNHGGSFENAKRLIKAAKRVGADAVKTQCYEAETLTLPLSKPDFIVQSGLWRGRQLFELYQKAQTPYSWHRDLYKVARDEGITIFSSVFDRRGVDLLESMGCPAYKIASFEIVDTPLIAHAASTGKPLILSTGLATNPEVVEAKEAAGNEVAILHCTSEYPADIEHANLRRMLDLAILFEFKVPVGLSDHTQGDVVPIAATAINAAIIEKHLKLAHKVGESEDDSFSMFPLHFGEMIKSIKALHQGMQRTDTDFSGRQFRRSLYAVRDIKKGEEYTELNIASIRPGYGLPPKLLPTLLGKRARRDWRRGDPLS